MTWERSTPWRDRPERLLIGGVRAPPGSVVAGLLLCLLLAPVAVFAHQVLTGSDPASGAELQEPPRELRLTFSEPVRLEFTAVELLDASGRSLALSDPRVPEDSDRVLVVAVLESPDPGAHVVSWRTTGSDGHAVQGRFGFVVLGPAPDSEEAGETPPAEPETSEILLHEVAPPGFNASSPLFVLTRWVTLSGLIALLGVLALRWAMLPWARRRSTAIAQLPDSVARRAAGVGMGAAMLILLMAPIRLVLQAMTATGDLASVTWNTLGTLISTMPWGSGWILQVAGGLAAVAGFAVARTGRDGRWVLAALAGIALVFSPPLSGHAVGGGALAVALHGTHVLVAGVWLGGLAALLLIGIPAARRLDGSVGGEAVRALVGGFSFVATLSVAILFLTGAPAAFRLGGSFDGLIGTSYGRVLLLKLGAVLLMGSVGAYNALRLKPRLTHDGAVRHLRRTGTLEVGIGVVILLMTAVLVALPLPR